MRRYVPHFSSSPSGLFFSPLGGFILAKLTAYTRTVKWAKRPYQTQFFMSLTIEHDAYPSGPVGLQWASVFCGKVFAFRDTFHDRPKHLVTIFTSVVESAAAGGA